MGIIAAPELFFLEESGDVTRDFRGWQICIENLRDNTAIWGEAELVRYEGCTVTVRIFFAWAIRRRLGIDWHPLARSEKSISVVLDNHFGAVEKSGACIFEIDSKGSVRLSFYPPGNREQQEDPPRVAAWTRMKRIGLGK